MDILDNSEVHGHGVSDKEKIMGKNCQIFIPAKVEGNIMNLQKIFQALFVVINIEIQSICRFCKVLINIF